MTDQLKLVDAFKMNLKFIMFEMNLSPGTISEKLYEYRAKAFIKCLIQTT